MKLKKNEHSVDINIKMVHKVDLAEKGFKAAIINMFKN